MASAAFLVLCAIFIQGEPVVQVLLPPRQSGSDVLVDHIRITNTTNHTKANSTKSNYADIRSRRIMKSRRYNQWRMEKNYRPAVPIEDNIWQPVGGANDKFYVYSAYCIENCSSIVIIGATSRKPDKVQCKVRYSNNVSLTSDGSVRIISENHSLKYSACFIRCSLALRTIPDSVSIVTRKQKSPTTNRLRVIDTEKYVNAGRSTRIGICVKPLHFVYNKTVQLVEFMELNRILGMDHVTFYNSSISPTTDCILRRYVSEGRATVLPWKDHFKSQKEIRTENMMAALNDCLYRNKHNFTYLAFLDMDEFIMPNETDTIQQLLEALNARHHFPRTGSYNFRNGFFYLQWSNEPTTNSSHIYERNLITLLKTRRMRKLHSHKTRSKYIVKPTKVVEVGNHQVHIFMPQYQRLDVKPSDGILNHYRICEFGGNSCVSSPSLIDRTALRYKGRLVAAVKHRWQQLRRRCGVGDIHEPKDLVTAEISLREPMALLDGDSNNGTNN